MKIIEQVLAILLLLAPLWVVIFLLTREVAKLKRQLQAINMGGGVRAWDKIVIEARKKMINDNNLTDRQAVASVLQERPDLYQEYMDEESTSKFNLVAICWRKLAYLFKRAIKSQGAIPTLDNMADLETWYKENGALGEAPEELEIYEAALLLHKSPDEVRRMSKCDVRWVRLVKAAQGLAGR